MAILIGQRTRRARRLSTTVVGYGKLNLKKLKDKHKRENKLARLRQELAETERRIRRGVLKTSAGFDLVEYSAVLRSQIMTLDRLRGDVVSDESVADVALEELPVPLPTEKLVPADVTYPTRDGQTDFRAIVLRAYGRCAVSGCPDEPALQAAHIIPYVDRRSNRIENGLCLRADIHCLFDLDLLRIDESLTIRLAPAVRWPQYRMYDGQKLHLPTVDADRPLAKLFSRRLSFLRQNPNSWAWQEIDT